MSEAERHSGRTLARMTGGILVWAVHFAIVYGYTGLACARRYESSTWTGGVPWVIGGATILASALLVAMIVPAFRARQAYGFVERTGAALAGLALAAVLLEGASVIWLPICT